MHSEPLRLSKDVEGKWEADKNKFVLLRPNFEQEPDAKFWLAKVMGYEVIDGVKNYLLQYHEPKPNQDSVTCLWHPNAVQKHGRSMYFDNVLCSSCMYD